MKTIKDFEHDLNNVSQNVILYKHLLQIEREKNKKLTEANEKMLAEINLTTKALNKMQVREW